jgi:hypothetical protein
VSLFVICVAACGGSNEQKQDNPVAIAGFGAFGTAGTSAAIGSASAGTGAAGSLGVSTGTAGAGAANSFSGMGGFGQAPVAGSAATGELGMPIGGAAGSTLVAGAGDASGASGRSAKAGSGGGGAAGSAGSEAGSGSGPDACPGGKLGTDSSKLTAGSEYAAVKYLLQPTSNEITDFKTTLLVPKTPDKMGTLFIWPGLQSDGGKDPARNGNGILQPVLTWGQSCSMAKPMDLKAWWIAGMYVNVATAAAGPTGCAGGDAMNVAVGDALMLDMSLTGTVWKQTALDQQTSKSVDFSIDLK